MNFEELTYIREDKIENVGPWVWIKEDTGLWEGPSREFKGLKDLFLRNMQRIPKGTIIQAGGGCGLYPRLWADVFEEVWTFEPEPLNYYCLKKNCTYPRIRHYPEALNDYTGIVDLGRAAYCNSGEHSILPSRRKVEVFKVCCIKIDEFMWESLDAIQLDVEGAEFKTLSGGINSVKKFRPAISIETCDEPVLDLLRKLDYKDVGRNVSDTLFMPAEKID